MSLDINLLAAESITGRQEDLARRVIARCHADIPVRYSEARFSGTTESLRDTYTHYRFLIEALFAGKPALFCDYLAWAHVMVPGYATSRADARRNLTFMGEVNADQLPADQSAAAGAYLDAGIRAVGEMPDETPTFIRPADPLADLCKGFFAALLREDRQTATQLVLSAADSGVPLYDLYVFVLLRSQYELERLHQMSRVSFSQQAFCADMTQLVMAILYSRLFRKVTTGPTMIAVCPHDELHELGLRVVADLFELAGWDTHYLGPCASCDEVLEALSNKKADVLAVSATCSQSVEHTHALIDKTHARSRAQVIVGGQAFSSSPELWRRIGADAYGWNADHALRAASALTKQAKPSGLSQAS